VPCANCCLAKEVLEFQAGTILLAINTMLEENKGKEKKNSKLERVCS